MEAWGYKEGNRKGNRKNGNKERVGADGTISEEHGGIGGTTAGKDGMVQWKATYGIITE